MNAVKDDIPALVEKELAAAMKVYPLFADNIHAWAVIRAEMKEAELDYGEAIKAFDNMEIHIQNKYSNDVIIRDLKTVGRCLDGAIQELLQARAMCDKGIMSIKDRQINRIEEEQHEH